MGILRDLLDRAETEHREQLKALQTQFPHATTPFRVGPVYIYTVDSVMNLNDFQLVVEFPYHPYLNFTHFYDRDDLLRHDDPTNYLWVSLRQAWLAHFRTIYIPPEDNIALGEE